MIYGERGLMILSLSKNTDKSKEIYQIIKDYKMVTANDLSDLTGYSSATINRVITVLKGENLINDIRDVTNARKILYRINRRIELNEVP
ncbi:MAG: hypothetical protein PHQ86_07095 [Dehalococcoidales bacterium]|nr:hypothetical protein [Dehalococcoidales bacterium]